MDVKKCDRCGAYYEKNKKHRTFGCIAGDVISGMQTMTRADGRDCHFDLCDDCIGDLKKFLNIKEPDKE